MDGALTERVELTERIELAERIELTERMEMIDAMLHNLCQPLTVLQCRLALGELNGEPEAMRAAIGEALSECSRMNSAVGAMREALFGVVGGEIR